MMNYLNVFMKSLITATGTEHAAVSLYAMMNHALLCPGIGLSYRPNATNDEWLEAHALCRF